MPGRRIGAPHDAHSALGKRRSVVLKSALEDCERSSLSVVPGLLESCATLPRFAAAMESIFIGDYFRSVLQALSALVQNPSKRIATSTACPMTPPPATA